MTKNFKQTTSAGLMVVATLGSAVTPVFADDLVANDGAVNANHAATTTVDGPLAADGSITIQGATAEQSIKNKKFEIFKIFDVENAAKNESVNYKFVDKYKQAVQNVVAAALSKRDNKTVKAENVSEYMAIDYIQSLNNHQVEGAKTEQIREGDYSAFRYFTEDLKNEIKKLGITGDIVSVASPNSNNEVTISGLSWGYYFVDEITTGDDVSNGQPGTTEDGRATDGKHYASSLVLVNTANDHFTIKLKSDFPQITKKIQEDDNKDQIGDDGYNDIGDYEIGQNIPYRFTSTIPNMNGYHTYYYTMHDKMDPELTFHANKAEISLEITDGTKTYKLKDNEYNLDAKGENVTAQVAESPYGSAAGETFQLEIVDIKDIVDREFNKLNADNENDYTGLKLITKYVAHLNDDAAAKTGRPGFENDVRLEFSNDPDSSGTGWKKPNTPPNTPPNPNTPPGTPPKPPTGYTPWDTVVAFTYKLNGIKVDNHNVPLENAQFKLYSDPEGKNEIFVKLSKGNSGPKWSTSSSTSSNASSTTANGTSASSSTETTSSSSTTVSTATTASSSETSGSSAAATETTTSSSSATTTASSTASSSNASDLDLTPKKGQSNETGTVGTTNNLSKDHNAPSPDAHKGDNQYTIINRDRTQNGAAPADAVTITSDANGNFSISGLDQGVYYLKEVKAPKGYRLLKDPIKLTVTPTMTEARNSYIKGDGATDKTLKALAASGDIKEFYHEIFKTGHTDFNTDVAKGSFDVKVINERLSKLPVTGEQGAIAATLVSVTLIAVGATLYIKHKQNGNSNETTL